MVCEIRTTDRFERQAKRLIKKYASLINEIEKLGNQLQENPKLGTSLGKNFYKIRIAIKSKGKGKSGGARIITLLIFNKQKIEIVDRVYLSAIYDKSEFESITTGDLEKLISDIGQI